MMGLGARRSSAFAQTPAVPVPSREPEARMRILRTLWSASLVLAGIVPLLSVAWAHATQEPFTPEAPDATYQKHLEELMSHPDDKEVWGRELERLEGYGEALEKARAQDPGAGLVNLAIANNLQLQGIALRHLKRYDEALQRLTASDKVLQNLRVRQGCQTPVPRDICAQISDQSALLLSFFVNVYVDRKDDVNVSKYLKLELRSAQTPDDYARRASAVVFRYLLNNDYDRAVKGGLITFDEAAVLKDAERLKTASDILDSVYLKVFSNISWRPTGERRGGDPRDFVEDKGLAIGADYKYGMTSSDEDHATFITFLFFREEVAAMKRSDVFATEAGYESWEALQRNVDIERYVRQQMREAKFELAAKYLYGTYINFGWAPEGDHLKCVGRTRGNQSITFAEVERQLAGVHLGKPNDNTRHMIELLRTGYDSIRSHCSKPGTEHGRP
jgi:hypothetical protein